MAQYSNLKAYIEEKIYENGTQAITGDILQDVLKVMTDDLGEFYQTGGVASPSTDPGTPDAKVIYFATEAGTYTNFGGITLAAGEVALLIFETSWTKETLNVLSSANGGVKTANLADGAVTTEKIAGGAVETAKIANNAVTSGKVADGAIGTAKIADAGVTADKIAANAVETAKIKNGAVTEGKINDGAVTADKVAANAVTTAKIADDAVTTAKLNDGAVTEDKIATDAVTSGKVKDGAIGTAKIAAGAVTHAKIGAGAVEESNIKDGAVTSDKIANGAVGSDQLAEGAFSAQNLADGSVTTDKLADDAVTAEKIADGAVTANKFANGSVTTIKLGSGAVTTEKIGDGMVTRQKLADSSVSTSKIIDGAVTTAKVADANVTTAKIADANVTTGKLADGAVTTAKIADGNVTGAKLQEGVRPVINVNALNEQTSAYGSAALARAAVPSALRILGLHVIYLLAGGWFEDEFIGSDVSGWGTASNWRAVGPVSVSQNTTTGNNTLHIGNTEVGVFADANKLIKLRAITTGGNPSWPDGSIYYNTSTKLLRQKIGNSYNTIPFYEGAIYQYGERLYIWSGTDLVDVNQINYPNQFAAIRGKEPILNTTDYTFTIPSGTTIICSISPYVKVLSSDITFTRTDRFGFHYLVLDFNNLTIRGVQSLENNIQLSNTEVIVCLVGWTTSRLYGGIFTEYYVGENLYTRCINKSGLDSVLANVIQDISSLYSEVNSLEQFFESENLDSSDLNETSGYYNLTGNKVPGTYINTSANWRCLRKQIKAGDVITIYTKGGAGDARAYAIADVDYNILTVAAPSVDTLQNGVTINITVDGWVYVNCSSPDIASFKLNIKRLKQQVAEQETVAPCMYNPHIDLTKSNLKVLDIGNSYTNDATHYIPELITAAGVSETGFSLYKAIRSAGSFKSWVDCYNDSDTLEYSVYKSVGETLPNVAGSGIAGDGSAFRAALTNGNWDIIMIHQASEYANEYSLWNGNGNGGYLKELICIIRKTNPNAMIGFLLVHSYRGSYSGNTEGSSLLRWQNIAESVKKLVANYGIDFIIPYGTAVQNLRASTILTDATNEFSSDGVHLADGIGDYVASCAYFQALFAPRFNKCILGNTYRKTDFDESNPGVKQINDTNALLAQKAALAACYDWYNINNPDTLLI